MITMALVFMYLQLAHCGARLTKECSITIITIPYKYLSTGDDAALDPR